MDFREKQTKHRAGAETAGLEGDDARDVYRILELKDSDPKQLGLRELNKLDKLQRIFSASRRQFGSIGYDATSLRDIAKEARVALGTLSFYAENKRELILLVFNATMAGVIDRCKEAGTYKGSLSDAVISYYRPAYIAYAAEPDLFRILLRENVFHTHSPHAREFHRLREKTILHIRELVEQARKAGEIKPYIDIDLTARTIFFLMFAAVRLWICTDQPEADAGLAELKGTVALLIDGMRSAQL